LHQHLSNHDERQGGAEMKKLFLLIALAIVVVPQVSLGKDAPTRSGSDEMLEVATALDSSPSRFKRDYVKYQLAPGRAATFAEYEYVRFHERKRRGLRRTIIGAVFLGLAGLGLYALDRMEPEPCTEPSWLVWPTLVATAVFGATGAIMVTIGLPQLIKYSRRMEALEQLQGGPGDPEAGMWRAGNDGSHARIGLTIGYRF
jgi:hypothetical protein